jgi:hypothetical protein
MEGTILTDIPTDADILQSLKSLQNQEVKAGAKGASASAVAPASRAIAPASFVKKALSGLTATADAVLNKGKDFSISPSSSSSSLYEMEWDANTDDMIVFVIYLLMSYLLLIMMRLYLFLLYLMTRLYLFVLLLMKQTLMQCQRRWRHIQ